MLYKNISVVKSLFAAVVLSCWGAPLLTAQAQLENQIVISIDDLDHNFNEGAQLTIDQLKQKQIQLNDLTKVVQEYLDFLKKEKHQEEDHSGEYKKLLFTAFDELRGHVGSFREIIASIEGLGTQDQIKGALADYIYMARKIISTDKVSPAMVKMLYTHFKVVNALLSDAVVFINERESDEQTRVLDGSSVLEIQSLTRRVLFYADKYFYSKIELRQRVVPVLHKEINTPEDLREFVLFMQRNRGQYEVGDILVQYDFTGLLNYIADKQKQVGQSIDAVQSKFLLQYLVLTLMIGLVDVGCAAVFLYKVNKHTEQVLQDHLVRVLPKVKIPI